MSKNLPYFKFFTSEWLNGDVTLLEKDLQGLFINVCAYYWHKECELTLNQAHRRFGILADLIDEELISIDECDFLRIDFLDEQFAEFSTRKKQLSDAGKKGALAKKKKAGLNTPTNHPSTTILKQDKEVDNINKKVKLNITERKKVFATKLLDYTTKFGAKTVNDFFLYWSEHGDDDKKMRFEKQTSFSIARRIGNWKQNENKYGTEKHTKNNKATTTNSTRQEFN